METSEIYRDLLIKLLPKGKAWQAEPDSFLYKFCWSMAEELARVDGRIRALQKETDPRFASELLPEWEEEYGLPDSCSVIAGNIPDRRDDLVAKITGVGGQSAQYFIDILTATGSPITINIINPTRAGDRCGSRAYGRQWKFIWIVNIPDSVTNYAVTGEAVTDDPLSMDAANTNAICFLEKNKPAHTDIVYTFNP